ncbi:hypothetical protein ACQP1U_11380 [Actinomycetota bacterium]
MLLVLLVPLLATALASPWLPERVASHYRDGVPDASAPLGMIVLVMTVVGLVPLMAWVVIGRLAPLPGALHAIAFVALMSYAVVASAGLACGILAANIGVDHWSQARSPGWAQPALASAALAGLAVSVLVAWRYLANSASPSPVPRPQASRLTAHAPSMRLLWLGQAHNRPLVLLGGITSILTLGWATWQGSVGAAVVAVLLGLGTSLTRAEAVFDGAVFRARIGALTPWRRIPVLDIEDAEVVHVSPAAWLGYGVRWRGGEQAFVVRSGPGVRVTTRSGPSLVVSVDDPATAVQLIRIACTPTDAAR